MRLRKRTAILAAVVASAVPLGASAAAPAQANAFEIGPWDFQIDMCMFPIGPWAKDCHNKLA